MFIKISVLESDLQLSDSDGSDSDWRSDVLLNTSGSSEVKYYEYLNIFFVISFEGLGHLMLNDENIILSLFSKFQSVEYTAHFMEIL